MKKTCTLAVREEKKDYQLNRKRINLKLIKISMRWDYSKNNIVR